MKLLPAFPDYKVQHGKMVIEAKPHRANKGYVLKTLSAAIRRLKGRAPVMVGDDATDEDAICAALVGRGVCREGRAGRKHGTLQTRYTEPGLGLAGTEHA